MKFLTCFFQFVLSVVSGVLMILGTVALTKRLLRKSVPKTLVDKDAKYSLKLLKKEVVLTLIIMMV